MFVILLIRLYHQSVWENTSIFLTIPRLQREKIFLSAWQNTMPCGRNANEVKEVEQITKKNVCSIW